MRASGKRSERRSDAAGHNLSDRGLTLGQRLRRSSFFQEAFKQKRQFVGAHVVLWLRSGDEANRRLGVVASKRTFPEAVDRNRAKRLMREAFRLLRDRVECRDDVVLLARRRLVRIKRPALDRELRYLFRKAGIWRESDAR